MREEAGRGHKAAGCRCFQGGKMHLGLLILDQMPTKEFRSAWGQISDRLKDNDLCITLTELQARL